MLGEVALSMRLEMSLSTRGGHQGVSRTLLRETGREIASAICRESRQAG